MPEEKSYHRCEMCGEDLKEDTECHQLRFGHIDEDGEFVAEEDEAYFCTDCGVERGNF